MESKGPDIVPSRRLFILSLFAKIDLGLVAGEYLRDVLLLF